MAGDQSRCRARWQRLGERRQDRRRDPQQGVRSPRRQRQPTWSEANPEGR
ncbi:MAG: hypothetical protein ACK55E_15360 [Cyanobacteriota bacterium]